MRELTADQTVRTDEAVIGISDAEATQTLRDEYRAGWNEAIDKTQDELVRRDQFSERTLRILDGLRLADPESHNSGTGDG